MKKSKTNKKGIRISKEFLSIPTWEEFRIHEVLIYQQELMLEIDHIKLEQKQLRQQITALAGAVNILLDAVNNEETASGSSNAHLAD